MDLTLELDRKDLRAACTLGKLFLPTGEFLAFTLERPWSDGQNRHDLDCIPTGTYELKFEMSPHFGRQLLHVQNVPNRDHVMIHPANKVEELLGCIALGKMSVGETVTMSRDAVEKVEHIAQQAMQDGGRVFLKITNP